MNAAHVTIDAADIKHAILSMRRDYDDFQAGIYVAEPAQPQAQWRAGLAPDFVVVRLGFLAAELTAGGCVLTGSGGALDGAGVEEGAADGAGSAVDAAGGGAAAATPDGADGGDDFR
jgi:hypothetical protein